ncbi:MAG: hypothetical protein OEY93_10990, partial [Anaerolineae bacterium]|nr:hypothetical protein [Anaerolineae bacterium]
MTKKTTKKPVEDLSDFDDDEIESDEDDIEVDPDEVPEAIIAESLQEVERAYLEDEPVTKSHSPVRIDSGDDPVRLYLREIGQVELLDIQNEFWLATQVEAVKRLQKTSLQHPIAKRGNSTPTSIYSAMYDETIQHWKHLLEDVSDLGKKPPQFTNMLDEAQDLQTTWNLRRESYVRNYLNNGMWAQSEDWDEVARTAFKIFTFLYLLPSETAAKLKEYFVDKGKLPNKRSFNRFLPNDEDLE